MFIITTTLRDFETQITLIVKQTRFLSSQDGEEYVKILSGEI